MPATTSTQVKAPLPAGHTTMTVGTCPTCHCTEWAVGSDTHTRSDEPGADGRYVMHPHHDWCPVWTGETPELACTACGAPVLEWDFSAGVQVTVPHAGPSGRDDYALGTVDEVGRHMGFASKAEPCPEFDQLTVKPCGHELRGHEAHPIMDRLRELRLTWAQREADATLAQHAVLLPGACGAGHANLVELYRRAVYGRSKDAAGLLAAIRAVADA